jgi:hypothetical protein
MTARIAKALIIFSTFSGPKVERNTLPLVQAQESTVPVKWRTMRYFASSRPDFPETAPTLVEVPATTKKTKMARKKERIEEEALIIILVNGCLLTLNLPTCYRTFSRILVAKILQPVVVQSSHFYTLVVI